MILAWTALVAISASASAAEKLSVLIVDGHNNHKWKETTPVVKRILEDSGRFTVSVATAPADKNELATFEPKFSDYDVVLSNYNGPAWSEATQKAFEEYVSGGGGFVCLHAANNAFTDWDEYNVMIGLGGWGGRTEKNGPYIRVRDGEIVRDTTPGRGGSHGKRHPFLVEHRQPDHPILKGLPTAWMHEEDELYDRLRGPAKDLTVLATAYSSPDTGGTGENEPMLMVIDYGQGRVFHTTLGHDTKAMSCIGFEVTLQRGTEWAATGEVTLTDVPDNFPRDSAVSTRPQD